MKLNADEIHFAILVNRFLDKYGEELERIDAREKTAIAYMNRKGAWLNSQEVRELEKLDLLDEPNTPRPCPSLVANQTTANLTTYHRVRVPQIRKKAGEWRPRTKTIPLNAHVATVLLSHFRGKVHERTVRRLERVANGWVSRQRIPKTQRQAVYA